MFEDYMRLAAYIQIDNFRHYYYHYYIYYYFHYYYYQELVNHSRVFETAGRCERLRQRTGCPHTTREIAIVSECARRRTVSAASAARTMAVFFHPGEYAVQIHRHTDMQTHRHTHVQTQTIQWITATHSAALRRLGPRYGI